MTLDIREIEAFFGAKFEPQDAPPDELRQLICFDGFVYWRIWLDEQKQLFHFTVDKDALFATAFPTVELAIFYSGWRIQPLVPEDMGTVFCVRPRGKHWLFAITKTPEGRLSLCTSLGHGEGIEDAARGWFKDDV